MFKSTEGEPDGQNKKKINKCNVVLSVLQYSFFMSHYINNTIVIKDSKQTVQQIPNFVFCILQMLLEYPYLL